MRITDSGSAQPLRNTGFSKRIQEATLDSASSLTPLQVAGLQKFYAQSLETIGGIRSGEVGKTQELTPADLAPLFPEQDDLQAVLQATAPNLNDNGDARQIRSDYRTLLRELRREDTRAANTHQNTRTTRDGEVRTCEWRADEPAYFRLNQGQDTRLELLGTTVRRTHNQLGSTQVEQFRLDAEGNPSRELLLAYDGSAPQRVIARPDGSAQQQLLTGYDASGQPTYLDQRLPAGAEQASDTQLKTPWWREPNPADEWESETTPAQANPPKGPEQTGIVGLSPNQTRVVAHHYDQAFAGDLRAEARRDPKVGGAIEAFGKRTAEPPAAIPADQVSGDTKDFCAILDRLFDKLDKDHDGKISMVELKAAMHDPSFKGADAAAVATVFIAVDQEKDLKKGFTKEQLAQLKTGGAGAHLNDFMGGIFSLEKNKLNGTSQKVFDGPPDPMKVRQGKFGTCYFIAALVAKAQADPEGLKNMIKDNGNGTFTVTFPGAKTVTINSPTDTELLVHASAGANGKWVTILEIAYAKMKNDESYLPDTEPMDKVEGGSEADGINPLTKKGVDTDSLWATSEDTTRKKVKQALADHKMITAGVSHDLFGTSDTQDGHAYTVIGYDPKTDRVTLRNPWGTGGNRAEPQNKDGSAKDGKMDGVFQLTIHEFDSMFSDVAYEQ